MKKMIIQILKLLFWPIILLVVLFAMISALEFYPLFQNNLSLDASITLHKILQTAIWLTFAWLATLVLEIFLWRGLIEKRIENKVPRLLKTALNVIVLIIFFFLIIDFVFHRSITGLIATTGVVGIILGFGFRGTIENAVSGITLSVDPVFKIGDWVALSVALDSPARVVEMTWRYTIFQDEANNLLIVPNNMIFNSILKNYSRPIQYSGFTAYIGIYVQNSSIERVKTILEAALKSTHVLADDPPPTVRINDIREGIIVFQFRYWIDFRKTSREKAKHELYTSILHHFSVAGISLDITTTNIPGYDLQEPSTMTEKTLQSIDLFSELSKEEIIALARGVQILPIKAGEVLIRQNGEGASMYVLAEGLLKVDIEDLENKQTLTVAKILPGEYFGEMSLLVGDPRSATISTITDSVVYEISKETMQRLFEFHPNLVQLLSKKVAERHTINLQIKKEHLEKDISLQTQNYADRLFRMIKNWFRIK